MKRISCKRLLEAASYFKAHPDGELPTGVWTDPSWNSADFWLWFHDCLAAKINASDLRYPKGRKASGQYALELVRLRPYVGSRLVLRWVAPCLGARVKAAMSEHFPEAMGV